MKKNTNPEHLAAAPEMERLRLEYEAQQIILRDLRREITIPLKSMLRLSNLRRWQNLTPEKKEQRIYEINEHAQSASNKMDLLSLVEVPKREDFRASYNAKSPMIATDAEEIFTKYEKQQTIVEILKHDMTSPLMSMSGLSKPKRWQNLNPKERDQRIKIINNNAQIANDRMGLLDLMNISKEELQRYSETIQITEAAKVHVGSIENYLRNMNVGLYIKSTGKMGFPLDIYAHKAAMGSILENLIGGGLNHAPEKSKIKLGIREYRESLEIMAENEHINGERIRSIAGKARGLGLPFIEEIACSLEGSMELYDFKEIGKEYGECAKFGYMGEKTSNPDSGIFGVKLTIPMSNLKKPRKSQQETIKTQSIFKV